MRTLKEIKEEFYDEGISQRSNYYLSEDERYIIDNLKSPTYNDNELSFPYTKEEAANIAYEALDGLDSNETESAMWECGYVRGYEEVILSLLDSITNDEFNTKQDVIELLKKILDN